MASSNLLLFLLLPLLAFLSSSPSFAHADRRVFAEYIGAEFNGVKFTDVPINPNVDFHFLVSFAIDYTTSETHPTPNNGHFHPFWQTGSLTPSQVSLIKQKHRNVRVGVSLGGSSITEKQTPVYFHASSVDSWVDNAVSSLTKIIKQYHFDGIDIDYEQFKSNPYTFAECIGKLITTLKKNGVISFASIAPYNDDQDQAHFLELWRSYRHVIDYVNYQFYSFSNKTTVTEFMGHFDSLSSKYGGKIFVSFATDDSGGLKPGNGFFRACKRLKSEGKLHGIAVWSADTSKKIGFKYEKQAQALLA